MSKEKPKKRFLKGSELVDLLQSKKRIPQERQSRQCEKEPDHKEEVRSSKS